MRKQVYLSIHPSIYAGNWGRGGEGRWRGGEAFGHLSTTSRPSSRPSRRRGHGYMYTHVFVFGFFVFLFLFFFAFTF